MKNLIKFVLCFALIALVYLVNVESAVYPVEEPDLQTWYFHKTDDEDNRVLVIGPHSDKVIFQ